MKLAKFPLGHAALVALGAVLLAGAAGAQPAGQATTQKESAPGVAPPRAMLPGGRMMPMLPNYRTNFAFIPANTPASSSKVGIFVAKHREDSTTLYYCAMSADATGNSVCKEVKEFTSE